VAASQVIAAAKRAEISERKLRRAAHELGVVKTKEGYQGAWVWSLQAKDAKDASAKEGGIFGIFEKWGEPRWATP
jgi:hypothetical protein